MNIATATSSLTTRDEPVGDLIARTLAEAGVTHVFGVISIHNMPILDAIFRQGRITFVPARGEAGAMNMADAYARVSRSVGVVITSTGTAAGNAAGSQVEALTAGSPVLHITTQIDTPWMDRDRAAIHDVPRQPDMLKAVSKAYFRLWDGNGVVPVVHAAISAALSAPTGPVSLEIPVDVQRMPAIIPPRIGKPVVVRVEPDAEHLDVLADMIKKAKRPMLYLGGGARGAEAAATALVERGFCAATSTNGRASVPEDHPRNIGAFNMTPQAQDIYDRCDLMIVVGSRLRGNETRNNMLRLGKPLIQIDADASQGGRNYPVDLFVHGDARLALEGLLARLPAKVGGDKDFEAAVLAARIKGEEGVGRVLGVYKKLADVLRDRVHGQALPFVRDVTIGNSTFGNRYVRLAAPHLGVHALGGGIGQGIAMTVGAAFAANGKKTVSLVGDGGSMVNIGELATVVENACDTVIVMMNDKAYGVIANIQDAQYGNRHAYCHLHTPDFGLLAKAMGLPHVRISKIDDFEPAFDKALAERGPIMLEVDMVAIGPYAEAFGGPPAGAAGGAR
ncbi:thiamine pyrophosphate-binding protein [Methylocella sp. CPCC 101449]|jgi:acetolactate synthase-1/2/3 large subunit|uniref:thiamine pyrophosphate-binding protein n=1 Tax=Methylocella sp. CPCC 101449 TaxID=2987531 RepID=UPI002890ED85|nr:thiamine pyrophosphate-binding protein [Methylocella sp. CPCC 101449]MDT2022638.1 thiamine pyrophosphate-binding protein [Methylocella sp. CPCC 101449]HEV2572636.1 thiamine pyrophosphate-binding protein [Beijerinckiaceae bacterium]